VQYLCAVSTVSAVPVSSQQVGRHCHLSDRDVYSELLAHSAERKVAHLGCAVCDVEYEMWSIVYGVWCM
jgi:hypothetical protein